jgi:hypothetical protein
MTGPRSISKDATKIYSTWFSVLPRGYCERSRRGGWASRLEGRDAPFESELCCEETPVPVDGVLLLELGYEVWSVSDMIAGGGRGDRLEGLECCEIRDAERDEGKDEREALWF